MHYSPLRYPGGKSCLRGFISELVTINGLRGGSYLELYAGGAGAALNLLYDGTFRHIHINDYDYHIYAMWYAILNHPQAFINRIRRYDATIDEWHRQQTIFTQGSRSNIVDLGFATFFLNRTNRSGILFKAGPIGGLEQKGNYKINVRYHKEELIGRIKAIAARKDDITLTNLDAQEILVNLDAHTRHPEDIFIYLDPPYYNKGKELYMNNYNHEDHRSLSKTIENLPLNIHWLISYDNVREIKTMYDGFRMSSFDLNYTVQSKKMGSELLIFAPNLQLPTHIAVKSRHNELTLLDE